MTDWIMARHLKRQEWQLIILFDFLKIVDYQSKKTKLLFDKLKTNLFQNLAKSLPQVDFSKFASVKIRRLITCQELGSDEALIQLLSLSKNLSLPSQGMQQQMTDLK